MLKLKRDFTRAVTLLSFVKKRERLKKARLEATLDILEKRGDAEDWDSRMLNEINAVQKYKLVVLLKTLLQLQIELFS